MRLVPYTLLAAGVLLVVSSARAMRIDPEPITAADAAVLSQPIQTRVIGNAFVLRRGPWAKPVVVLCAGQIQADPPLCKPPLVLVKGLDEPLPRLQQVPGRHSVKAFARLPVVLAGRVTPVRNPHNDPLTWDSVLVVGRG